MLRPRLLPGCADDLQITKMKQFIQDFLWKCFFQKKRKLNEFPSDFADWEIDIIKRVRPYTMTSNERLQGLIQSVKYIVENDIPGDIVECGVWKGGSMMAAALTLQLFGDTSRKLWLYDTYEGMTSPSDEDVSFENHSASDLMSKYAKRKHESEFWAIGLIEEVQKNLGSTAYPEDATLFIRGDVLDTIPRIIPERIALLRLDTDWYASTKHEMVHLYPRLVEKGVLIVDDYGYWRGSQKAIDEYFEHKNHRILLCRLDETGRVGLKTMDCSLGSIPGNEN